MAKKFIPDGDSEFALMARSFVSYLVQHAQRIGFPQEDAEKILSATKVYRDALTANSRRHNRSRATVMTKDAARMDSERLIREAGHRLRLIRTLTPEDKVCLRIVERPARLRPRKCPQIPPEMKLLASLEGGVRQAGKHVISFCESFWKKTQAKPEGADRLELFVDLLRPGEKVIDPSRRTNGHPLYLRSYTRSPIQVDCPKSDVPVRVIYWARWANNTGEVGPFSKPLVAPVELTDWSHLALPGPEQHESSTPRVEQRVIITSARRELPDCVETIDTLRAESSRALADKKSDAA